MGFDGNEILEREKERFKRTPIPSEKSLPLAIGLNFVVPGFGYFYMGSIVSGVFAMALCAAISYLTFPLGILWIPASVVILDIVLSIDMILLNNKRNKKIIELTTMVCPKCAEKINRAATVCRFCGNQFSG